jgi:hypothetical protein
MHSPLRLAALCAALSCCLSISFASSAGATTVKPVRAVGTEQQDGSFLATAECPDGRRVVGGGFRGADGSSVIVNKAVGNHAWTVRSFDTDRIAAIAYCSQYRKLTTASATGTLDQPGPSSPPRGQAPLQGGATASCPSGSKVVSGGWEYESLISNSPVYTSRPVGTTDWKVYAASDDQGSSITAYAYCVKGKTIKIESSAKSPLRTGSGRRGRGQSRGFGSGINSATTSCPKSSALLGGGFETTPQPDFYNENGPDTFFSYSTRSSKREWTAQAVNYSNVSGNIQAFALCATP